MSTLLAGTESAIAGPRPLATPSGPLRWLWIAPKPASEPASRPRLCEPFAASCCACRVIIHWQSSAHSWANCRARSSGRWTPSAGGIASSSPFIFRRLLATTSTAILARRLDGRPRLDTAPDLAAKAAEGRAPKAPCGASGRAGRAVPWFRSSAGVFSVDTPGGHAPVSASFLACKCLSPNEYAKVGYKTRLEDAPSAAGAAEDPSSSPAGVAPSFDFSSVEVVYFI
jgi:hypothetical protein